MRSMSWVSQGMLEGRDKDLLTGEGFALLVAPRKGNQGLYENPKADFIQVSLYLPLPCLTHPHLHGTIQEGSSMDTWGLSAGMLSSGGGAAPAASPHSCHSRCQAEAPAGPSFSSCSHRFGSQFGSEGPHFNIASSRPCSSHAVSHGFPKKPLLLFPVLLAGSCKARSGLPWACVVIQSCPQLGSGRNLTPLQQELLFLAPHTFTPRGANPSDKHRTKSLRSGACLENRGSGQVLIFCH